MRNHEGGDQQLDFEAFVTPESPAEPSPAPRPPERLAKTDHNVYGDDFALVRVRDGFYSDERRVFYVSRGRVYLVRSPRMRAGQGFRQVAALSPEARVVDEAAFNPDDPDDQALFAIADCIDGIHPA